MPLSSELAVNRLKVSNTAGKVSFNTGPNSIALFKLKSKTKTTLREIFGDCPWADPFSFADYVQALNLKDFNAATSVQITTPVAGTTSSQAIIYESQGDVIDAITGDTVPLGTIVFLSIDTFSHDIGDAEIPSPIYTAQSLNANTDVTLANGNRAIGVIVA
jgi:hypothetical protein